LAKVGFTQSYTYFTWRNTKAEIEEYMNVLTQTELSQYFRPNFWPNTHDILPYALQTGKEAMFKIKYFLAATLSANCGIFGPTFEYMVSAPMPGKEEYLNSEKYEIGYWDWKQTNGLIDMIAVVNKVRNEQVALQQTNNIAFCPIENSSLIAYYKWDQAKSNHILCIVNLDPDFTQSGWVKVPLHLIGYDYNKDYEVIDLLTQNSYIWNDEMNFVELNPTQSPVHLFKINI
jgi:starch synthase (maltosyl-transferring)